MLIFSLATGNFVIGLGAFVVIGLLNPISAHFGVSTSHAAMVFAVYTATYAVMSPLLIGVSGRLSRRSVLVGAMVVFVVSSLLTAFAPSMATLLLARAMAAIGGCVFTPVAASVAFSASLPERRARALSHVFLGMTGAQALGVPAGTFIGYAFGWQAVFWLLAVLSLITIALLLCFLPRSTAFQVNSLRTLANAALDWRQMAGVLVTTTNFGAMCVLYAFISPVVAGPAGLGDAAVTWVLLIFGIGAAAGSLVIGYVVERIGIVPALATTIIVPMLIMPAFSLVPLPVSVIMVLTFVWALCGPGFMIPQQTLLIERSPDRQTIMLALNATANYAGTTIGAAAGALIVHRAGLEWLGLAAGGFAALALGNFLVAQRLNRPRR